MQSQIEANVETWRGNDFICYHSENKCPLVSINLIRSISTTQSPDTYISNTALVKKSLSRLESRQEKIIFIQSIFVWIESQAT